MAKAPEPATPVADLAVFIGRFQPPHIGHLAVIEQAARQAEHVLVLVGSSNLAPSLRNPFTYGERLHMLEDALSDRGLIGRVTIKPLPDRTYDEEGWISSVQVEALKSARALGVESGRIALIGYAKDHSSYYLKRFPLWQSIRAEGMRTRDGSLIGSTAIRRALFPTAGAGSPDAVIPPLMPVLDRHTWQFLQRWVERPTYHRLVEEAEHQQRYKASWASAPFPPTFVTVDAVVVQSGHILMVHRGHMPGKGLWALPGGFINQDETLIDAALRELREETRLKVPEPVLRGSVKAMRTFDDPHRSSRGRTITHAFLMHLQPEPRLPQVRPASDAKEAFWMPLGHAVQSPEVMFEDHAAIIDVMVRQI